MYENIGDKLCKVAKFVGGLGIAMIVVGVIMLLAALSDSEDLLFVAIGAIVGGAGTIVSSWPLYAFGQVTNDIHALREKSDQQSM